MKKQFALGQVELDWLILLVEKDIAQSMEMLDEHPGHPIIELRMANMEDMRVKLQGQKTTIIAKNNRALSAKTMEER